MQAIALVLLVVLIVAVVEGPDAARGLLNALTFTVGALVVLVALGLTAIGVLFFVA